MKFRTVTENDTSPISLKMRRFAELEAERRVVKARLDEIEDEKKRLEPDLLEQFAEHGLSKMTINGLTFYVHSQLWAGAKDGDYPAACAYLRDRGLGQYIEERFNTNSISAYFRELDTHEPELMATWTDDPQCAISITERFSLRARAA